MINYDTFKITDWLPTTVKEMEQHGWEQPDIVLVTGDAYIDHPAFGAAVIGRILEHAGYKVAIVPQPNWQDDLRDFKKFGAPRLFFGVTAGNMDSLVNHYTANKRLRSDDAYTPDGKAGFRPDYAVDVYSKILKTIYPDVPVILGGIEASMRRFTHYDYWADELRPSILASSGADMLVYGNGEKAIVELANRLHSGAKISEITDVPQTAYLIKEKTADMRESEICPLYSHEVCKKDKKKFAQNFKLIETESNKIRAKLIIQRIKDVYLIANPQYAHLTESDADIVYDLPYTRLPHPKYRKRGAIPAFDMIKHSVNIHRGCFGGCAFCTISAHQGKFINSRSEKSILSEVEKITQYEDFKGHLSDIGGPSANMYRMKGKDLTICEKCERPSCIFPTVCQNLDTDHSALTALYQKISTIDGIKKASIGSGIRYDIFYDRTGKMTPSAEKYAEQLLTHHVSGRLKIAPEHTEKQVLDIMRKPAFELFQKFTAFFDKMNTKLGLRQQLIPYFISSHPGSTDEAMAELALKTKQMNFRLEQVQDLTPTPMTLAEVIYYSGYHPYTLEKVYTPRTQPQKIAQKLFFFWYKKENRFLIQQKLKDLGRLDLVKKILG